MKKTLITTILAGAMVFSLAACTGTNNGSATGEGGVTDGSVQGVHSVQSVYGLGAVTTAKLLEETNVSAKPLAVVLDDTVPAEGQTDAADPNAGETAPDTGEANPDAGQTDPTTPDAGQTTPDTGETTPGAGETTPGAGETPSTDPTTPDPQTPNTGNGDYQLPDSGSDAAKKAEAEAETFNKYFTMLEGFMEKGATSTIVTENDATDEALQGYEFKLIIKGRNEKGEENVHTMYYSETVVKENDQKKDDDDDDEVKTVSIYTLDGVLDMGQNEAGETVYYYMTGRRVEETEQDGKETETSSTLTFRASAVKGDTLNYVLMEHETESEQDGKENETETEYTYSVYQNGKRVETTTVDFETENAGVEYELSYSNAGGVRNVYEIELKERGGNTYIEVEYNLGGTRGKFVIVRDADGNCDYKFSTSTSDDRTFNR